MMQTETVSQVRRRRIMTSRAWSNVPIGTAAIAGLLLAAGPAAAQVQDQKLLVQARIGEICTVTAASLDFGTYAFTGLVGSGSIAIECIAPTALAVALDGGQAGNGNGLRTMKNGSSNLIYQLQKPTGEAWETGGTFSSPSATSHAVVVNGTIDPSHNPQGALINGLYTDEVTITLVF
jgi:spore coat protein U-like protein